MSLAKARAMLFRGATPAAAAPPAATDTPLRRAVLARVQTMGRDVAPQYRPLVKMAWSFLASCPDDDLRSMVLLLHAEASALAAEIHD